MNAKSLSVQPEWLVNCFLEAFEGNPYFWPGEGKNCQTVTIQCKNLEKNCRGRIFVDMYAGMARQLLPEGPRRKQAVLILNRKLFTNN